MNAAIARRLTGASGQYAVAAHPAVTLRFFTHSTLGQNGLALSTSVKPAQGTAPADTENMALAVKRNASERRRSVAPEALQVDRRERGFIVDVLSWAVQPVS
jgi:hypothetical protein